MAFSSSPHELWSTTDIVLKISKHMKSPFRFRSVFSKSFPNTPLRSKPLPFPFSENKNKQADLDGDYLLLPSTYYAIQPFSNSDNPIWLIKTHSSFSSPELKVLENPLTRNQNPDSPPGGGFDVCPYLPEGFNALDYSITEIGTAYSLIFVEKGSTSDFNFGNLSISNPKCLEHEVAVSSARDVVMAIVLKDLYVWRSDDKKRVDDEKWVEVSAGHHVSVVYRNDTFFALTSDGSLISVDPISLEIKTLYSEFPFGIGAEKKLVGLGEGLFCFSKIYDEPSIENEKFKIHMWKFDEENLKWNVLRDELEEGSLFLCEDISFFLPSIDFPGCVENSVYLSHEMEPESDESDMWDEGEYDMREGFQPGCDACRYDRVEGKPRALSKVQNIFWPPPTWLIESEAERRRLRAEAAKLIKT